MLDYLRMGRVLETDMDEIITAAGGQRFSEDHSKEKILNCDYQLEDCLIELKIIEEEGLEKEERQKKLADLFEENQSGRPTVIVDPVLLDESGQRRYYQIMSTPIKTAVKKAAKQLDESSKKVDVTPCRVLLLINNGYAALSHEEFQDIALKRASLDTRKIDALVVVGLYYYSDTFDMYSLGPCDTTCLNIERPFQFSDEIRQQWNDFMKGFMTEFITEPDTRYRDRMPVVDFEYSLDGIRYVKPAPRIGKPSGFFPHGRLRQNSTGNNTWPVVAHTFPALSRQSWDSMRELIRDNDLLGNSYPEWLRKQVKEEVSRTDLLKPFVPVKIEPKRFEKWLAGKGWFPSSVPLCEYACETFEEQLCSLINAVTSHGENKLVLPDIILLVVEEIGQDKANDYGSIVRVRDFGDGPQEERLVKNERLTYEHGLVLAGVYAVKLGIPAIMYHRSRKYVWE